MSYNFTVPFKITLDESLIKYCIIRSDKNSLEYGETINLDVDAYLGPDILSYTYTWTLDSAIQIGVGSSISWTLPAEYDSESITFQVLIEGTTIDSVETISTFKTITLPRLLVASEYNFLLTNIVNEVESQYSNMDIHRFLSYFPKWSSAHKNFYSNSSKLLSPLLEQVSNSADRYDTFIDNNSTDGVHFGFKEFEYKMFTTVIPRYIRTEYGICNYIGEELFTSIESTPIRAVKEENGTRFIKEKHNVEHIMEPIVFAYESYLFIKDIGASAQSINIVLIVGMDHRGNRVKETIPLFTSSSVETINKFKIIFKVITSREIEISTFLDLETDTSFINGINLQKRISAVTGEYFEPLFEIDGRDMYVLNGSDISKKEEFRFSFTQTPQKLFVNNLLDVIFLRDNSLFAGKLMLDYYNLQQDNSSTNNNDFVYVEDEITTIGNNLNVTVNTDRIRNEFKSKYVRIGIKNGDIRKYLSSEMTIVDDKNTWLPIGSSKQVMFSIPVTNDKPYVIQLKLDNITDSLYAMGHSNNIQEYKISEDTSDIFIYNKDLWKENGSGEFKILKPVRLAFTSSKNTVHLFNDFSQADLI